MPFLHDELNRKNTVINLLLKVLLKCKYNRNLEKRNIHSNPNNKNTQCDKISIK